MKKGLTLSQVFLPHFGSQRKAAFTKPRRGMNEVKDERQATKMLSFRCCRERCRFMRGAAFTLAEVLITLGIIGVVAAMTMPSLLNKNQERVTVTKVKKFYSMMNQALLFAINEHGYVDEWNFYEQDEEDENSYVSDKFVAYIKPYLKISKDCGQKTGCLESVTYKELDGSGWINYETSKKHYKMVLADGSYLWIRSNFDGGKGECSSSDTGTANVCGLIWLDSNGKLPPNVIGKDTFIFFIMKNRIIPHTKDDCEAGNTGWGCAAYILQHGDMKYIYGGK